VRSYAYKTGTRQNRFLTLAVGEPKLEYVPSHHCSDSQRKASRIMTEFTPVASLVGGTMLGIASVLLMASHGRIAGVSGIAVRIFPPYLDKDAPGRMAFILGLIAAPLLYATFVGAWPTITVTNNATVLVAAGLLAGFGSVWGSGCTSGHGICGLSLLSLRSVVAVVVFMATAIVTVFVTRHLVGG
jgi:uncharacterized membrane protein YedE/YeeE